MYINYELKDVTKRNNVGLPGLPKNQSLLLDFLYLYLDGGHSTSKIMLQYVRFSCVPQVHTTVGGVRKEVRFILQQIFTI